MNSGWEYDRASGQDHSTEMVTLVKKRRATNPAQTTRITIKDSSMTKVHRENTSRFYFCWTMYSSCDLNLNFVKKLLSVS